MLTLVATALLHLAGTTPATALSGDVVGHDPSVMKVGSCYYSFATDAPTISVRRTCAGNAATGWTRIANVWGSTPRWIIDRLGENPTHIWAPDIKFFNNRYYLYYAASIPGKGYYAVMGLLTSPSIEGPWTDQGMITDRDYPIDPAVEWGQDGRLYVAWGSWYGTYMRVLDPATGKLSTSDTRTWRVANGIEGQTFMYRDGYYYLFGSEGSCCIGTNSTYYTVVGRSTSLTGPYLDRNGVALTAPEGGTVVMRGAWPKVGAGGADVYDDGAEKYLAYHYYNGNQNGRPELDIRHISMVNGWPVLSAPLDSRSNHLVNQNSNMCADVWGSSTADGAPVNQYGCHSAANQFWTVTRVGDNYRLVAAGSGKCLAIAGGSTAGGAAAVQQTCNSSTAQLWTRTPTIGGYFTLANVNSRQCLELSAFSTTAGTALTQYTCNGGANQQWLLV
ncbi:RICIN domain-containing protein [Saccharothrix isguenensis]